MKLIVVIFLILPVIIFAQLPIRPPIRPRPTLGPIEDNRVIPDYYFTVVAPLEVRQGRPYDIYIRGFHVVKPIKLNVKINGTRESGKPYSRQKSITLSKKNYKGVINFDSAEISNGNYELYVEAGSFSEKRTLKFESKRYSFLILLNKAIFLPGDLVQYKIFAINSETKSINPKCSSVISISDQNNNLITSNNNVTFQKGKYAGEFQLSNKASLGNWQLQISCDQETVNKNFEVAEYTLPLIDGKLIVDEYTPFSYGKVPLTVDVSYTFGGDVSGDATITILKYGNSILKKDITIESGSTTIDLDIVQDLNVQQGEYGNFQANLVFEDPMTNTKVTDTKSFTVAPYIYNIYTKSERRLQPGRYDFTVTMKKFNGAPAPAGIKVQVIPDHPNTIPKQTLTLGSDGTVASFFDIPPKTDYLSVNLKAPDAYDGFLSASTYVLNGDSVELRVLTEKPKINEYVDIEITTGVQVDYVMLHIVSKGILLESSSVWFDDYSKITSYSFRPSLSHIPSAQIIAYYITSKGNFIVGQTYVEFTNLNNYLSITPHKNEVKPGEKVYFDIESYVDSTVSLAAVDQRVLLLKSGHNVTRQNVYDGLQAYNIYEYNFDWQNTAPYEYSFGGNGLYIFTNIPRPPRHNYPRREMGRPSAPGEKSAGGKDGVKIRKDFRETFLWRDVTIANSLSNDLDYDDSNYYKGLETISEKVPESITSYLIYGVSMSEYDGIGLSDDIPSVTTFLPFFLSVEFPYSVKRNEVLVQAITIFNYLRKSQKFEIKITKDSKFIGVDLTKYGWKDSNGFYVQTITTKVGKHVKLLFALKPKVIGFATFKITAKGPLAGDGLEKKLRVIPEGVPRSITKSTLIAIDPTTPSEVRGSLTCELPDSAYLDTTEISGSIVGDIFGKAFKNIDNLIHLPSGCGEQTMLSFAPNIAIYDYLKESNKLTPKLKALLEQYTLAGYQNELKYQRTDGSFSAFGNSDPSGSTWLTAYVIGMFNAAKHIISIDKNVIKRGADFVASQQSLETGKFSEPGRVIHTDMQGGSGQGATMTAYLAIFFTLLLSDYPEYLVNRNKAISYLELHYDNGLQTAYDLAITAYAFTLAGSSKADHAYELFNDMRQEDDLMIYWTNPPPPSTGFWYNNQARSLDIESTAYGLLTYAVRGNSLLKNLKVVRYLVSKANSFGGYGSSQDTVMGFFALSVFARRFSSSSNIYVSASTNIGDYYETSITAENAFEVQSFNLNPTARKLNYYAKSSSSGIAVISLICNFYEDPTKAVPTFDVTYQPGSSCESRIQFEACGKYIPSGKSNMALMVITMPSGFVYNEWYGGNTNPDVSLTEVTNQGSKVTFYFNKFTNEKSCVTVNAYRSVFVAELKGGTIQIFDYYDTSKEGSTSYPVPDLSQPCYFHRLR